MNGIISNSLRMLTLALMLVAMPVLAQEAADATESVNINKAGAEELASTLDGVGPVKAEAIVAWRDEQGRFTTPEHLEEVDGIGSATVSDNREKIRLD